MDTQNTITLFNDGGNPYRELIETFLKLPLGGTDEIFTLFSSLPGAVYHEGEGSLQRFVYVPGTRKDRVLLTAHADTFWDERYGAKPMEPDEPKFRMGIYFSGSFEHGIGADDRAGCAMLWALRDSGHSLLLTDGEEKGKHGARYLRKHHKKLFRDINRTHRMILTLDAPGSGCYLVDQVDCSKKFCSYLQENLQVVPGIMHGGSDLEILCKRLCGANLGVGYMIPHVHTEMLMVQGWNWMYRALFDFLQEDHPRFTVSKIVRFRRKLARRLPRIFIRVYHKLKREGFKATAKACLRRIKRKTGPKSDA